MRRLIPLATRFICAVLAGVGALAALADSALAGPVVGYVLPPNWAFGSPQRPFISGCSDRDPGGGNCFGHFGLGPLSDVLDYRNVGQFLTTEASLNDNGRLFVGGGLEALNEQAGEWWDLVIPTARWIGLGNNGGLVYFLTDAGDVAVGDAIAYVNVNGGAHIWWWSNNSDDPTSEVPAEFKVSSFFDVFVDLDISGTFDNTNVPPPNNPDDPTGSMIAQCTPDPTDPNNGCMAADSRLTLPVPEPSSLALVLAGMLGLAAIRRRRQIG